MIGRASPLQINSPIAPLADAPQFGGGSATLARLVATGKALLGRVRTHQFASLLKTKTRRLRVAETVSLGEKRFVSIIEVDGVSFLIGGGTSNLALLAQLPAPNPQPGFSDALTQAADAQEVR